jgi:hypothetical protein
LPQISHKNPAANNFLIYRRADRNDAARSEMNVFDASVRALQNPPFAGVRTKDGDVGFTVAIEIGGLRNVAGTAELND